MIKREWQQLWHSRSTLIGLILIALIPAIYCLLYLSSMWNAYGEMDRIPVAIVNQDQSQHYHGKNIAIGQQLTAKLKRSDSLDYHVTTAKKAATGIRNGRYDMVVTIPKHFSSDATTLLTASPHRLHIRYTVDSGRNFVVSKMTSGAAKAIQEKVSKQVSTMYVSILLTALSHVKQGMANAATGSGQVTAGLTKLTGGLQTITDGANSLRQGMVASNKASSETLGGISRIANGLTGLHTGAANLNQGSSRLTAGLSTSVQQLKQLHQQRQTASDIASPVVADTTDVAKVPNNGTGMAPMFIAIGLFVGGIGLGTMFDAYLPKARPKSAFIWWLSKFSIIGVLGVLQGGLLFLTLNWGNHLLPVSQIKLLSMLLLGSLTFLSVIFCLRIVLGGFGTWLITILLVLQLSASSGVYPVELTSGYAQVINPYLPMTYLIDGLRQAISLNGSIVADVSILAGMMGVLNGLIILKYRSDLRRDVFKLVDFSTFSQVLMLVY
ncbi:MAG TPA: hypothetical protein DCW31_02915 [Lactobacillus sp.]|nr:hypothetical protein [Lactobacillus sp.]